MSSPQSATDIYCISGLGADQRIFDHLHIAGVHLCHLSWLIPEKNEPIHDYAARMAAGIFGGQSTPPPPGATPTPNAHPPSAPGHPSASGRPITGEHPILLGVSFGGMMAIEIAKHYPDATVILVSSIPDHRQLPFWMKLCGWLRLDKLVPAARNMGIPWLEEYFLGVETAEDAELRQAFRRKVSPVYLKWSIGQVLRWRNEWQPVSFYHIHGGKDRMFPIKHLHPTHVIPSGGHLMVNNRSEEITRILTGILTAL